MLWYQTLLLRWAFLTISFIFKLISTCRKLDIVFDKKKKWAPFLKQKQSAQWLDTVFDTDKSSIHMCAIDSMLCKDECKATKRRVLVKEIKVLQSVYTTCNKTLDGVFPLYHIHTAFNKHQIASIHICFQTINQIDVCKILTFCAHALCW